MKKITIWLISVFLIVISLVIINIEAYGNSNVSAAGNTAQNQFTPEEGREKLIRLFGQGKSDCVFKGKFKLGNTDVFRYENSEISYSINPKTKNIVSIIPMNSKNEPLNTSNSRLAETTLNNKEIEAIAKNIVKKCAESFKLENAEIQIDQLPQETERAFSVLIIERNDNRRRTGQRASVSISATGEVTFVCILDEAYPEIANQEPKVTKEEAIAIAYNRLLQEPKEVLVNYEKKEQHQVKTCLDIWKGKLIWDITIEGIKAKPSKLDNDLYDKKFHLKIDAMTGKVCFMGQNK